MKKNKVRIDNDKCKGCYLCISECKNALISKSNEVNKLGYHPVIVKDMSKCTGCAFCAITCPEGIIEITSEED